MKSQKHKFDLGENVSYLNCGSVSPMMKSVAIAGRKAIDESFQPYKKSTDDWFEPAEDLKKNFAQLINCHDHKRIAVIPAVSYGIATVTNNIKLKPGEEIIVTAEQFPSNYYSWHKLVNDSGGRLNVVDAPQDQQDRGKLWNERILKAITAKTKVVAIGNIHWTDGTLFDLEAIGKKAKENNALLIIDGTQSIGALPFDLKKIQADAVICAGYKWLLGPYSLGLAYFGEYFDGGVPLEENWINRKGSEDFQQLVNYTPEYGPLANRYNVGENSNFILIPMLNSAIEQINTWGVNNIQNYCSQISRKPIEQLRNIGCQIEDENYRSQHMFGIRFKQEVDLKNLEKQLLNENIFVSLRGSAVRTSVHVFNDQEDLNKLVDCIKAMIV